jgi:two-component system NarL family sensor kinase
MSALHPTVLQYGGLEAALLAVADQHGAAAAFEAVVTVDPDAAGAHDELVVSLARELLENTARHASATRVEVDVRTEPSAIVLSVADDGAGFPPGRLEAALAGGAIGVASCRERVEALGGTFSMHAAPGAGTRARAWIPVGAASDPGRSASISGDTGPADRE